MIFDALDRGSGFVDRAVVSDAGPQEISSTF